MVTVALDFGGNDGTRADEAHIAADDVPELRQLVEAGLAQEGAELRDARIVLELEVLFPLLAGRGVLLEVFLEGFLCVRDHRLELIAREEFASLAHTLMGKDDMPLVVDRDKQDKCQQDRRDQDTAENRADQIEAALDEAVPPAGQIVLEGQHENLFAEEDLRLDACHRRADEVRHESDVADMRLDFLDEILERLFLEARRGDDDVLDAGIAHDGLSIFHLAVEAELLRDAFRYRMVIDNAHHVISIAEVILEEAQHALCRPAGADQDDRPVEEMRFLQEPSHEIAHDEDGADDEDEKKHRINTGEHDTLLEQEEQDDAADSTVNDRTEYPAHGVKPRLHLGVDPSPH